MGGTRAGARLGLGWARTRAGSAWPRVRLWGYTKAGFLLFEIMKGAGQGLRGFIGALAGQGQAGRAGPVESGGPRGRSTRKVRVGAGGGLLMGVVDSAYA